MGSNKTRRQIIRETMNTWEYLVIEYDWTTYVETVTTQLDKELDNTEEDGEI